MLLFKALFFFADGGYPDFNRVDKNGNTSPPSCQTGADCVYSRYVAAGRGPDSRRSARSTRPHRLLLE